MPRTADSAARNRHREQRAVEGVGSTSGSRRRQRCVPVQVLQTPRSHVSLGGIRLAEKERPTGALGRVNSASRFQNPDGHWHWSVKRALATARSPEKQARPRCEPPRRYSAQVCVRLWLYQGTYLPTPYHSTVGGAVKWESDSRLSRHRAGQRPRCDQEAVDKRGSHRGCPRGVATVDTRSGRVSELATWDLEYYGRSRAAQSKPSSLIHRCWRRRFEKGEQF